MVEGVTLSKRSFLGLRAVAQVIVISPAPDFALRCAVRYACMSMLVAALLHAPVAGADNLVVIVNPASGITQLTRNQVIDIFLGRSRKLPSGEFALPIDLGTDTTGRKEFYLLLVGKDLSQMSSYWARLVFSGQAVPPFPVPNAHTALELVATNPSAIAYMDRASVNSRVRVVLEIKP